MMLVSLVQIVNINVNIYKAFNKTYFKNQTEKNILLQIHLKYFLILNNFYNNTDFLFHLFMYYWNLLTILLTCSSVYLPDIRYCNALFTSQIYIIRLLDNVY